MSQDTKITKTQKNNNGEDGPAEDGIELCKSQTPPPICTPVGRAGLHRKQERKKTAGAKTGVEKKKRRVLRQG